MHIIRATAPGALRLGRLRELSREARLRLQWMDYYEARGGNAALTCRHFGISRQTFYRWKRRYKPHNLTTLESCSHRPEHVCHPTWSPDLALCIGERSERSVGLSEGVRSPSDRMAESPHGGQAVLGLREQYPRWGKGKLVVLLRRQGREVSTSMVGRILRRLKERGVLREPLPNGISARRRLWSRPYAVRKPKEYEVKTPGDPDGIGVDTLDVRPLPGVVLKHFTARDMVSRWDVVEAHSRATATTAAGFLDSLLGRMPFPVKALQVDGGSELQVSFEEACQVRGIRPFVLPPRSPKLNGCVERAQRTHQDEYRALTLSLYELIMLSAMMDTIAPTAGRGGISWNDFRTS